MYYDAKTENVISFQELVNKNIGTENIELLINLGIYPLVIGSEPEYNKLTQYLENGPIVYGNDGKHYITTYIIKDLKVWDAKKNCLNYINLVADSIINNFLSSYPNTETASFAEQSTQARMYIAAEDKSQEALPIPLLRMIATQRNLELDDLVYRILQKTDAFGVLTGLVFGQRQKIEDEIDDAKTIEDLLAIQLVINVPNI